MAASPVAHATINGVRPVGWCKGFQSSIRWPGAGTEMESAITAAIGDVVVNQHVSRH